MGTANKGGVRIRTQLHLGPKPRVLLVLEFGNQHFQLFGRQYEQQLSTWAPDSVCFGLKIGSITLHPGELDLESCVCSVPQFSYNYNRDRYLMV